MIPRPISRVFGSKARVAPFLVGLIPPDRRTWVEVFAGSACVTLAKPPHPSEHLNDLDGDVVNLFTVLRDEAARAELIRLVALTPWAEQEWRAARSDYKAGVVESDPARRAWRYLIRCWMGVSGDSAKVTGFKHDRTASKQCAQVWDGLPSRIAAAARRLKRVHIHARHCSEIVARYGDMPDTVLFIDPPYPPRSINTHAPPYRVTMSDGEHAALAAQLAGVRCATIVTMSAGTAYDEALAGWRRFDLPVRGLMNITKIERVFVNFEPPGRLALDAA